MATKYIQDPNNPYASIPAKSPYFTQKPATTQTPTAPTPTTPTTPTAPTGSTQSYLDNLLSVATERGLDVQQILTNPNYVPPKTIVEKDFSGSNTVTNLVQTQLDALQKEKADAQAKLEAAGKGGATDIAGLIASYKTPTMDLAGAESRAETKYGTADALAKMQQQNAIVAGIQGELNQLNTEEMIAIDRAEGRVASRGAIEDEKNTVQRDYNIKKAYKNAELYAQAALAQVYSNNYENAQNLVAKAVDYYLTEIQQQIADYKDIFSMQSDWIKSLKDDEKDLLKMKYDELVDKEDKLYNEKMNVAELMLKYPSASISISDSYESAVKKAQPYEAAEQASTTEETTTEIDGWLNYLFDAVETDPVSGLKNALSSVPSSIRNDVISAYYIQKAFIETEEEKPKKEFLESLKTKTITPEILQQGYDLGLTLQEMKDIVPEKANELTQAQYQTSLPYKAKTFLQETGERVSGEVENVLAPLEYWLSGGKF